MHAAVLRLPRQSRLNHIFRCQSKLPTDPNVMRPEMISPGGSASIFSSARGVRSEEPEEQAVFFAEPPAAERSEQAFTGPQFEDVIGEVTLEDINRAEHNIRGAVVETPCKYSKKMSQMAGMNVYLKQDHLQASGSFKERGACNALMSLNDEQKEIGVIAASAGNHALALGYHGGRLGIPVTCVMPSIAPLTKINNCKDYGVDVVLHGDHIGEARQHANSLLSISGQQYINGFDHPDIIAGAGTMGMEILRQVPTCDAIIVPVGGAGLIAGVSLAVKKIRPHIQVIGVEPANCASWTAAMAAGHVVDAPFAATLADGLGVPRVGQNAFRIGSKLVDQTVVVSEREIALAVLRMVELEKTVVEGGAAAGVAGLLTDELMQELKGKTVVVAVCGGNIDTPMLGRVIQRGLAADHRLVRCVATISDRVGGLNDFTENLSRFGVSIHDIEHERAWLDSSMSDVQVKVVMETYGEDHKNSVIQGMREAGYIMTEGKPGICHTIN